ncbi:MAG: WG repeat-containing protein [Saprospiraceae bacterium]|nr:WG repeat-containing protein [Saprospiraceae bacterium]
MKKYLFIPVFFLLLLHGCKESDIHQTERSQEEMYFEDYESPEFKWGFIDLSGDIAIPARFDHVSKFSDGAAAVNYKGKWGYVDRIGNFLVEPSYKSAYPMQEGWARVIDFEQKFSFVNKRNESLSFELANEAGNFSSGLVRIRMGYTWGFANDKGDMVIDPQFEKAWDFEGDYAKVKNGSHYGLIGKSGNIIIPIEYNKIWPPSNGIVVVKKNEAYFALNTNNEILLGPFQNLTRFHNSVAAARMNDEYVLIDTEGRTISKRYENIRYAEQDRWVARKFGKLGVLSSTGEELSPFAYQQINNYSDDFAVFSQSNLWGYLDINGNEVIEAAFGLAWDFHNGYARAGFREGMAFINTDMQLAFAPRYIDIQDFTEGLAAVQLP